MRLPGRKTVQTCPPGRKTSILGKCKDQPSLPLVTSGTIEDKERIFTDLFTGRF